MAKWWQFWKRKRVSDPDPDEAMQTAISLAYYTRKMVVANVEDGGSLSITLHDLQQPEEKGENDGEMS